MNKIFPVLVTLSGFTVFNSVSLSLLNAMHVVPHIPVIGTITVWILIAIYIGAVIDIEFSAFVIRKIKVRRGTQ